jgi:hypothetical protein
MSSLWGTTSSFFRSDEELGKKDDDHKPSLTKSGSLLTPTWHPSRGPPRRSIKRIIILLGIACLIYLFVHNIPTDLGPARTGRPQYGGSVLRPHSSPKPKPAPPKQQVVADSGDASPAERSYSGPPKFLQLAPSLHAIAGTRGSSLINQNILFAASSLKSAAILLPIACQMGMELQNYVHFALMSRSEIKMEELRKLNGIDEGCQIIFHGMGNPACP